MWKPPMNYLTQRLAKYFNFLFISRVSANMNSTLGKLVEHKTTVTQEQNKKFANILQGKS